MTAPVVAKARRARKSTPGPKRRTAPPASLPPEGTEARRQRDAVEAIKAQRAPEPADEPVVEPEPKAPADPAPASLGAGPSLPAMPAAASTGSGFLLGVFVWALGLAYLDDGSDGVKKFLRNKFFNRSV